MRVLIPGLSLLLALPLALAQAPPAADNASEGFPTGHEAPDAEESIEGRPGWSYGGLVLLGTLVLAGALGYAAWRQRRDPPLQP